MADNGVAPGSLVLVAGTSGYVGGRLVTLLLERGYRVRCLLQTPAKVESAPWRHDVGIVQGHVGGDLSMAMQDVSAAYYLVHSIGSATNRAENDREVAENFRRATESSGIQRIVYFGGLGDRSTTRLSEHLASRQEVGARFRSRSASKTATPTTTAHRRRSTRRLPLPTEPRTPQPLAVVAGVTVVTGATGVGPPVATAVVVEAAVLAEAPGANLRARRTVSNRAQITGTGPSRGSRSPARLRPPRRSRKDGAERCRRC